MPELNLPTAGITPPDRGLLRVDHRYRTPVEHIYAAGDVSGPRAPAATAMEQARWAVTHAFGFTAKAEIASFNYRTLGDLYKFATYDAILQRAAAR